MIAQEETIRRVVNALPHEFQFYHLGKVELQSIDVSTARSPVAPGIQLFTAQQDSLQFLSTALEELITIDFKETDAIAYHLFGDLRALIIILFAKDLDFATYSELGNVLASKIANQLSLDNGADILISPPQQLNHAQIEQLIQNKNTVIRRTYTHLNKNSVIPIATWVLPTPSEGFGYA